MDPFFIDQCVGFDENSSVRTEEGVAIHEQDKLHDCIAQCLIEKPALLNGKEFRFLRTMLDLSQTTMGLLCGREERRVREMMGSVVQVYP